MKYNYWLQRIPIIWPANVVHVFTTANEYWDQTDFHTLDRAFFSASNSSSNSSMRACRTKRVQIQRSEETSAPNRAVIFTLKLHGHGYRPTRYLNAKYPLDFGFCSHQLLKPTCNNITFDSINFTASASSPIFCDGLLWTISFLWTHFAMRCKLPGMR